jgi:hypothetical protein
MGTQSLTMNAEVSGSKAVDGVCYQHQFKGQSSEGAGISLVTDYASNFDAVALAEHHKSEAVRLGVIKEGHEEEERRPPPAQLQLLFQKQPGDIKPEKLSWSKYTQEQAQRGGLIGGPAANEVRSKHHIFSPPLAWAKIAVDSGLGVPHAERKPRGQYKLKYDPIELRRDVDVAISGFFEVGEQLPMRSKRKARLADRLGEKKRSAKFCTAWDQLKDHEFRLAK